MEPTVDFAELDVFLRGKSHLIPMRGMISIGTLRVPVLFVHRADSQRLVVHYNGAVNRNVKPDGILFQRSSWIDEFPASVLFISDPTLVEHSTLVLGWGQIRAGKETLGPAAAKLASQIARMLRLDRCGPVVHVGSSAGGFQAMCAAAYHRHSAAWVNNAQFDWLQYEMNAPVDALVSTLGYPSREALEKYEPERHSIPRLVEMIGSGFRLRYVLNSASTTDVTRQLPVFEQLSDLRLGRPMTVDSERYEDRTALHDPMQKGEWLASLSRFLQDTES